MILVSGVGVLGFEVNLVDEKFCGVEYFGWFKKEFFCWSVGWC